MGFVSVQIIPNQHTQLHNTQYVDAHHSVAPVAIKEIVWFIYYFNRLTIVFGDVEECQSTYHVVVDCTGLNLNVLDFITIIIFVYHNLTMWFVT
jgi:hypothetical protein